MSAKQPDALWVVDEFIRVSAGLSAKQPLHDRLGVILQAARRISGAEAGRIYALDRTKSHLYLEVSQNERVPKNREHLPLLNLGTEARDGAENPVIFCARSGRAVNLRDVYRYTGFDCGDLYTYDRAAGYRTQSFLAVPLRNHLEVTIGILVLVNARGEAGDLQSFPEQQERVVRAFAQQAAITLNSVQLIEENERLIEILNQANRSLEEENRRLKRRIEHDYQHTLVGDGVAMRRVFDLVDKVIDSSVTVLLRGETGTGKELVAAAIHRGSPRAQKPFVVQNCAALPEGLLESELFGYRKGAFTGADQDRKGLIESADGGTLFLDEIGDMPLGLQAKLLRVLQDHEVRPLGASQGRRVDVRIIAATHCDLEAKIADKSFREDLYYRLCVFPIDLPPLRERRDDIPALVQHFAINASTRFDKPIGGIAPATMDALMTYDYPGNVRELRNLIERAVLLCEREGPIMPEHLSDAVAPVSSGIHSASGPVSDQLGVGLKAAVQAFEADLIARQLEAFAGNQSRAADSLKVPRRTLAEKVRKYGLLDSGEGSPSVPPLEDEREYTMAKNRQSGE
ncbi:MAG: sigma-54-dependent Fis family transcriptional regulator [Pseudomonadota bacterium]|nr:sigma-54-dependent Fis family transcriptional regulator [Pseudomonadota bacterium]